MSGQEIKTLRQQGKLAEALEMATALLKSDSENIRSKRSLSWVYYDYLKKYAEERNHAGFTATLLSLKDLGLPQEEIMVFDNSLWQIGKVLYQVNGATPDFTVINSIFDAIKTFQFTKPSEGYSFIYKGFHKVPNWSRYVEFADWWDFKNFRPGDYDEEEFRGKKTMALAEQAYIAYSRNLAEGEIIDLSGSARIVNQEKIKDFLPHLDALIQQYPNYQYPPYFKAKLLLALGNEEDALIAFLPFARQKKNNFWIWDLLAEIHSADSDINFACYCKALSLNTPDDFLVKLREKFAAILISKGMMNEAKTEIENIVSVRVGKGWKISGQIADWRDATWYKQAEAYRNNNSLYKKHIEQAEEVLFGDIKEEIIVVEYVNSDKSILNFVRDEDKLGYLKYGKSLQNPIPGELLRVRFEDEGSNGYFKTLSIRKAKPEDTSKALRSFENVINIREGQNFGFVDGIFVDPQLIANYSILGGDVVKGKAILSFNKKKEIWGWRVLQIEPL